MYSLRQNAECLVSVVQTESLTLRIFLSVCFLLVCFTHPLESIALFFFFWHEGVKVSLEHCGRVTCWPTIFFRRLLQHVEVRRTLLTPLLQVSFHDNDDVEYRDCISHRIRDLLSFDTLSRYPFYGQPDVRATRDQGRIVRKTEPYICVWGCSWYSGGGVLETLHRFQAGMILPMYLQSISVSES